MDITAEDEIPVGKNVLEVTNIYNSANYTCIAASTLGQIEAVAMVKVQCMYKINHNLRSDCEHCLSFNLIYSAYIRSPDTVPKTNLLNVFRFHLAHKIRFFNFFVSVFCSPQTALPTAPTDVIISEVAATSVRLEWSYKGSEDLQYYVIQYKPKNANQVKMKIKLKTMVSSVHIC